jgi:CRP/FNR family transcriptional regulator
MNIDVPAWDKVSKQSCGDCPIRNRAVCSASAPDELSALDAAKSYRDYAPGAEIVAEGEDVTAVGSIVSGVVGLQRTMEDGRRQMVGLLFPSDFIGRPFRTTAPYDAVAVTDVRMCMFQRSKFASIMERNRSLEHRLLEMTMDELDAAREWMLLLGRMSALEKLARFLLMLARRASSLESRAVRSGDRLVIPLSRESIAEHLGLTIETVSRVFSKFRRDGLIDLPRPNLVRLRDQTGLLQHITAAEL